MTPRNRDKKDYIKCYNIYIYIYHKIDLEFMKNRVFLPHPREEEMVVYFFFFLFYFLFLMRLKMRRLQNTRGSNIRATIVYDAVTRNLDKSAQSNPRKRDFLRFEHRENVTLSR